MAACQPTPPVVSPFIRHTPSPAAAAQLAHADADMLAGRWTEAEAAYRRLGATGDAHAGSHLALLLTYESRSVEAVTDAMEAAQLTPDSDNLARLTRALDWSGDIPAAVAAGAQAVAAAPVDPLAYAFDAEALSDAGRYREAEVRLHQAEAEATDAYQRAEAAREWSNYYRDLGPPSNVHLYAEQAQQYEPGFPERTIEVAADDFETSPPRTADAQTQLDALLKSLDHEPAVLSVAAGAAFQAGDHTDAERYYRAALAAARGDPAASIGLAEVLVSANKDPDGARAVLMAALAAHPDTAAVSEYLRELDLLVLHRDPAQDVVQSPVPATGTERRSAYDAVNAFRVHVGLAALAEDGTLAQAAEAHAYYVLFNWGSSKLAGLGVHAEDPSSPGFTGQNSAERDRHFGYSGYQSSEVINHTLTAAAAVEVWADSVYHRFPIAGRESVALGYGEAQAGSLAVNVLDFGVGPAVSAAPVLEPYPGQTGVPPTFTGSEIPDPAPSAHYPLGYPITVTFGAADGFSLGSARLLNHQGTALPLVVDRPGQVDLAQNEVALLPRAPLQPGTTYQVQVRGFLDGRAWSRSWSFTTAL